MSYRTEREAGYTLVHARLKRERGRAALLDCVDCGGPSHEWSYDGTDPDQLEGLCGSRGCAALHPFSTDLSRYVPRCRPCHRKKDLGTRVCIRGHDTDQVGRTSDRRCRECERARVRDAVRSHRARAKGRG